MILNNIGISSFDVIKDVKNNSEVLIMDFNQINSSTTSYKNIKIFFEEGYKKGIDPKLPENRQRFNETFLALANKKYLIGKYGEDRKETLKGSQIAKEGRTIHLGVDIFSKELNDVNTPYNGEIVRTGFEPGPHSYGHYIIVKHEIKRDMFYTFYGHLSKNLPKLGLIKAGERIGSLGDFTNGENGGWSRHLHFQLLTELPPEGQTPIGYSTKANFEQNKRKFPDPNIILQIPCLSS